MVTQTYIFKVNGMHDPSRLRMAQNALFRELLVRYAISRNGERLTLRIQENSFGQVPNRYCLDLDHPEIIIPCRREWKEFSTN